MKSNGRFFVLLVYFMIVSLCLCSCEKKEGKVIVLEQEFNLRQDTEYSYVMDAKGKIKNEGEVDLKNIVVTGHCRSCDETLVPGHWMVSPEIEKTKDQIDSISYLPAGAEEEFNFNGVAFIYNKVPEEPTELPQDMEVVIESFEIAE